MAYSPSNWNSLRLIPPATMPHSQYSADTARVFAYTALSMLPALSIFVFAQRYLVGGLVGAIRG